MYCICNHMYCRTVLADRESEVNLVDFIRAFRHLGTHICLRFGMARDVAKPFVCAARKPDGSRCSCSESSKTPRAGFCHRHPHGPDFHLAQWSEEELHGLMASDNASPAVKHKVKHLLAALRRKEQTLQRNGHHFPARHSPVSAPAAAPGGGGGHLAAAGHDVGQQQQPPEEMLQEEPPHVAALDVPQLQLQPHMEGPLAVGGSGPLEYRHGEINQSKTPQGADDDSKPMAEKAVFCSNLTYDEQGRLLSPDVAPNSSGSETRTPRYLPGRAAAAASMQGRMKLLGSQPQSGDGGGIGVQRVLFDNAAFVDGEGGDVDAEAGPSRLAPAANVGDPEVQHEHLGGGGGGSQAAQLPRVGDPGRSLAVRHQSAGSLRAVEAYEAAGSGEVMAVQQQPRTAGSMQAGLVLKVLEHLIEGEAAANQAELFRLRAEVGVQRARADALQVQLEDSSRDQQAPPPEAVSGAGSRAVGASLRAKAEKRQKVPLGAGSAGAGGVPLRAEAEEGRQKQGSGVWEPLEQPFTEATYHSEFL